MSAMAPPLPKVNYSLTTLGAFAKNSATYPGGLDLVTPSLALQPGALRACLNYEVSLNGGYSRVIGYERCDGQNAPSAASFTIIELNGFTNVPNVGDAVDQVTSGATGVVAAVVNGPDVFYLVLTKTTGSPDLVNNWEITSGSVLIGTAIDAPASLTALQQAQYTAAAADIYRAAILKPPGSGAVLGVVTLNDVLYAFRNNIGGTAAAVWKATTGGWVSVPLLNTVAWTAGTFTSEPADGATLTQGGVTATIKRVMTQGGIWDGSGTAFGVFVITTPAGGNFTSGAATITGGASVTLSGAEAAIVLQPSGKYEFSKGNFFGQAATRRAYGCDGVNQCFEFDDQGTLSPITTGLTIDTPSHIIVHKEFLFVGYKASASFCGPGTPYRWSAIDGGGEIALGDNITGFLTLPGSQQTATLAIYQTFTTSMLYGVDETNWQVITYNTQTGARVGSMQNLFDAFSFGEQGVVTLQSTLNFGNFNSAALTRNIKPFIDAQRSLVVASGVVHGKGQYRVFFSNGYGLYLTVANSTYLGAGIVLLPDTITCVECEGQADGEEVFYAGSQSGYVYQMEKGTSFDGAPINASMTLAWDALKSPRIDKRFRACSIEMTSDTYAAIGLSYELGYGSSLRLQPPTQSFAGNFMAATQWDSGATWDSGFIWDGSTLSPSDLFLTGRGENIQVTLSSGTNYMGAYTINSIIYHWSAGRGIRP